MPALVAQDRGAECWETVFCGDPVLLHQRVQMDPTPAVGGCHHKRDTEHGNLPLYSKQQAGLLFVLEGTTTSLHLSRNGPGKQLPGLCGLGTPSKTCSAQDPHGALSLNSAPLLASGEFSHEDAARCWWHQAQQTRSGLAGSAGHAASCRCRRAQLDQVLDLEERALVAPPLPPHLLESEVFLPQVPGCCSPSEDLQTSDSGMGGDLAGRALNDPGAEPVLTLIRGPFLVGCHQEGAPTRCAQACWESHQLLRRNEDTGWWAEADTTSMISCDPHIHPSYSLLPMPRPTFPGPQALPEHWDTSTHSRAGAQPSESLRRVEVPGHLPDPLGCPDAAPCFRIEGQTTCNACTPYLRGFPKQTHPRRPGSKPSYLVNPLETGCSQDISVLHQVLFVVPGTPDGAEGALLVPPLRRLPARGSGPSRTALPGPPLQMRERPQNQQNEAGSSQSVQVGSGCPPDPNLGVWRTGTACQKVIKESPYSPEKQAKRCTLGCKKHTPFPCPNQPQRKMWPCRWLGWYLYWKQGQEGTLMLLITQVNLTVVAPVQNVASCGSYLAPSPRLAAEVDSINPLSISNPPDPHAWANQVRPGLLNRETGGKRPNQCGRSFVQTLPSMHDSGSESETKARKGPASLSDQTAQGQQHGLGPHSAHTQLPPLELLTPKDSPQPCAFTGALSEQFLPAFLRDTSAQQPVPKPTLYSLGSQRKMKLSQEFFSALKYQRGKAARQGPVTASAVQYSGSETAQGVQMSGAQESYTVSCPQHTAGGRQSLHTRLPWHAVALPASCHPGHPHESYHLGKAGKPRSTMTHGLARAECKRAHSDTWKERSGAPLHGQLCSISSQTRAKTAINAWPLADYGPSSNGVGADSLPPQQYIWTTHPRLLMQSPLSIKEEWGSCLGIGGRGGRGQRTQHREGDDKDNRKQRRQNRQGAQQERPGDLRPAQREGRGLSPPGSNHNPVSQEALLNPSALLSAGQYELPSIRRPARSQKLAAQAEPPSANSDQLRKCKKGGAGKVQEGGTLPYGEVFSSSQAHKRTPHEPCTNEPSETSRLGPDWLTSRETAVCLLPAKHNTPWPLVETFCPKAHWDLEDSAHARSGVGLALTSGRKEVEEKMQSSPGSSLWPTLPFLGRGGSVPP
ncbi:hypothetical protein Cadr_000011636 [Camelus dromedarius]|uniref:Uncharacterized protein n=1 Tax=Camelus dromedarius TaxID=9838 RepID=A0A5N4DPR4_CAMDR|nr:hypothetical protein Cadr_000011636 [Camelus dromedarius]